MPTNKCPTAAELNQAKMVYWEKVPQDLFYRVATELIALITRGKTTVAMAEAISVLLQTWNSPYYRHNPFTNTHFKEIENLIERYGDRIIADLRPRSILSANVTDKSAVSELFSAFEQVLKPVGAVKALHLLAPKFFPLWDKAIAAGYKITLGKHGTNADKYWDFMKIAADQCKTLSAKLPDEDHLLKRIDEYNYCHYTRNWI